MLRNRDIADEMFYRQVECVRWSIDVKRVDWRLVAQTRMKVGINQIIKYYSDKTAGDCQFGSGRDRELLNGRRRKRDDGRRPRDVWRK